MVNIDKVGKVLSVDTKKIKVTKFQEFSSTKSLIASNSNHKALCGILEAQRN